MSGYLGSGGPLAAERLRAAQVILGILAFSYIAYSMTAAVGYCEPVPLWFMIPFFLIFWSLVIWCYRHPLQKARVAAHQAKVAARAEAKARARAEAKVAHQ